MLRDSGVAMTELARLPVTPDSVVAVAGWLDDRGRSMSAIAAGGRIAVLDLGAGDVNWRTSVLESVVGARDAIEVVLGSARTGPALLAGADYSPRLITTGPVPVCVDGFESGDLTEWSESPP